MRPFWIGQYGPLREEAGGGEGGGGGAPAFDPKAFQTSLMAEVNKTINGAIKNLKTELKPKDPPEGGGEGSGGGDEGDEGKGGKGSDPAVKALKKQVEQLTAKLTAEAEARQKTETSAKEEKRLSLIRTELAKHGIADHSVDDAFRYFRDEVKYAEDGSLIGGTDETPLAEFIKATVEKRTHWLPPKQAGGAGASSGKGGKGTAAFDTSEFSPDMTPERKQAALASIQAALQPK